MRAIHSDEITNNVREMCIQANLILSDDIKSRILSAGEIETSPLGKRILGQLKENLEIAKNDQIPICQDIGQDVHIEGALVEDAVNEGIRQGYRDGYLRKSVVSDPILRENTKDNTPGIIHYSIVQGENLEIIVAPKGFGSENMSRTIMLKPADGIEGIRRAVVETVMLAGPNACPPIVVGVGIGGDFEKSAILAKKALTRDLNIPSSLPHIKNLEEELLKEINETSIGPGGLGGKITALGVNIETYPTHIAGLPVAVNICCHVNRHVKRII